MCKLKTLQLPDDLYSNLKLLYTYKVELLVRKKMRLKKNNVYICRIRDGAKPLLEDLLILTGTFQFKNEISKELVKKEMLPTRVFTRSIFWQAVRSIIRKRPHIILKFFRSIRNIVRRLWN